MDELKQNIEFTEPGLQCDNPDCDWTDYTITFENYHNWLNKNCPKCGQNVLTEEDYKNAEILRNSINIVNSLTEEELNALTEKMDIADVEAIKQLSIFSNTKGLENLKGDGPVEVTISTHKQIKADEIKNVE